MEPSLFNAWITASAWGDKFEYYIRKMECEIAIGSSLGPSPWREISSRIISTVPLHDTQKLDEQPGFAPARAVLAENDLAFAAIYLADPSCAIACMPALLEAQHVDVEMEGAVHVCDEEDRARVPPVSSCHG
jgi:hypothetical protein